MPLVSNRLFLFYPNTSVGSHHGTTFTLTPSSLLEYNSGFQNYLGHRSLSFCWKLFPFGIQPSITFLVNTPGALRTAPIPFHKQWFLGKMNHWPVLNNKQTNKGLWCLAAGNQVGKKWKFQKGIQPKENPSFCIYCSCSWGSMSGITRMRIPADRW